MNFVFLRHSEYHQPNGVPSAVLPHPITDEGIQQAVEGGEKIVEFFQDQPEKIPDFIECSVLLRAYQTAEIIQDTVKNAFGKELEIIQTKQLAERNVGAVSNLTVREIEEIIEQDPRYDAPPVGWKSDRNYKLPFIGCESLKDAGQRVADYLLNPSEVLDEDQFRIIVGHGASFRHAAYELGILTLEDIPALSMHYAEPLFFEEQGDNFVHVGGDWKVRTSSDQID